MSDTYRIVSHGEDSVFAREAVSRELGPSLNEVVLELVATLAGIGAVFVGIMTVVGLVG